MGKNYRTWVKITALQVKNTALHERRVQIDDCYSSELQSTFRVASSRNICQQ
jgi:hypothetical protein